jgi:O-antigen ligase
VSNKQSEISFANQPTKLGGFIVLLICATAIISTVAYGLVDSWGLAFLSLNVTVIVIFWMIDALKRGEVSFTDNRLLIPIIGLILIGIIQLLPFYNAHLPSDLLPISTVSSISTDPFSTRTFVTFLTLYLFFFASALTFIDSKKRIKKVAVAIIIFGTIMAFFAIIQRLANIEAIYGVRILNQSVGLGSFVNQHHFAAFMEMTISLTCGILLSKTAKKEQSFLLIFSLVLMIIVVFFTGSRGGMLSLFGIATFFIFSNSLIDNKTAQALSFKNKLPILALILTIAFVILGITFFLGGDASLIRGIGLSEMTQTDFSTGRLDFWKVAIQIFLHNPIFGAGLDSFPVIMTKYDTWNGTFRIEQAHNDYLQILAEAGIFGLFCVGMFVFLTFKNGLKNIKASDDKLISGVALGALAGCLGIFIHSFFDFPLRTPSNTLIFLILVTLATASLSTNNKSNSSF